MPKLYGIDRRTIHLMQLGGAPSPWTGTPRGRAGRLSLLICLLALRIDSVHGRCWGMRAYSCRSQAEQSILPTLFIPSCPSFIPVALVVLVLVLVVPCHSFIPFFVFFHSLQCDCGQLWPFWPSAPWLQRPAWKIWPRLCRHVL